MNPLILNGFVPPSDFPVGDYEAAYARVAGHNSHTGYGHFVGAWSAISYRYGAVAEYDQQLTSSITTHGPGAGHLIRYEQERDLFEFFANGLSVFGALCFGAFAIGAITRATAFPLMTESGERNLIGGRFLKAYGSAFPGDPMEAILDQLDRAEAMVELRRVRNILSNCTTPPRQFGLVIGTSTTATAGIARLNLTLDSNMTAAWRSEFGRLFALGELGRTSELHTSTVIPSF